MPEKVPHQKQSALPALPPAVPNPLAARAVAADLPALVARIRDMTRASRAANHESQAAVGRAADADGVRLSHSRLARLEKMEQRSEIDLFAVLWLMARGGYTWADLYPPLAGASDLSQEEAELLRAYRAALPHARPSIRQYADLMARESVRTAERPGNVHDLPRPAAHPSDALAREQASHDAYAHEQAALDAIEERQAARKKRPRRFYGNGHK